MAKIEGGATFAIGALTNADTTWGAQYTDTYEVETLYGVSIIFIAAEGVTFTYDYEGDDGSPIGLVGEILILDWYEDEEFGGRMETRFYATDIASLGLSVSDIAENPALLFSGVDEVSPNIFADNLEGREGNDTIAGGARIYGGDGDDTLTGVEAFGEGGNDTISAIRGNGGDGNDLITMTDLDDEAHGGAGDDVMRGSLGADKFFGDDGFDIVTYAQSANGVFVDMKGAVPGLTDGTGDVFDSIEAIVGSSFDDALRAGDSSGAPGLVLAGGAGDDTLVSRAWNDILIGGVGDDTLTGGSGVNTVIYADALAGVQVDLRIVVQQNTLGDGRDTLTSIENLIGSAYADTLTGNDSANVLLGGAGADVLNGGAGADQFFGGAEGDIYIFDNPGDVAYEEVDAGIDAVRTSVTVTLGANIENLAIVGSAAADGFGNELANEMFGNAAANTLAGGAGNDRLEGGGGADVLKGDAGADTMKGGAGDDLYYIDSAFDIATEELNAGLDTIIAARSWAVASNFERVILSGSGDFNVAGNGLANVLKGNSGNNWINGSFGKDTLTGGGGRDSFIFNRALGPNNIDTITDYDAPRDVIRIDNAVFSGIGPAGALSANQFRIGAAASDGDDHIIYNSSNGRLYFDVDGTGAAAQIHFATLTGAPTLNASEFIII